MEQKADVNKSESRTPSCVSKKLFDIRAARDKQEGAVKLTRSRQGIKKKVHNCGLPFSAKGIRRTSPIPDN